MDKDTLDDLKQFITATVSQQISGLETRLVDMVDKRFDENDEKLDEILNVLGQHQQQVDETLDDHERRIVKLERKAA